jgi:MFS superfamily sulfate permease-like transporter
MAVPTTIIFSWKIIVGLRDGPDVRSIEAKSAGENAARGTASGMGRLKPPVRGDVVAGISVALVLIPQSLAYAELAGVAPVYGLYCAMAAPLFAALVGSSPYLQTGPVAITSLLTLGAVAPLAATGSVEFAALAALLALIVGVVRLLVGLLRAGVVAHLMSQPVVAWFTVAAAALIVASQVPDDQFTILAHRTRTEPPLQRAARCHQ